MGLKKIFKKAKKVLPLAGGAFLGGNPALLLASSLVGAANNSSSSRNRKRANLGMEALQAERDKAIVDQRAQADKALMDQMAMTERGILDKTQQLNTILSESEKRYNENVSKFFGGIEKPFQEVEEETADEAAQRAKARRRRATRNETLLTSPRGLDKNTLMLLGELSSLGSSRTTLGSQKSYAGSPKRSSRSF